MNQLSGKYVNVILSIENGKGLEFIKNDLYLTANFNNRLLESDKTQPEERVQFNTELIWEIEKKDLRKIRMSNQPLRIECLNVDAQSRLERIGFLLLSLRSAQIIPLKEAKTPVVYHWQKLIGCQVDKRRYHPELYLALTIRDHLLSEQEEPANNNNEPFISEEGSSDNLNLESPFPITFLPDGYIRIGPESDEELLDSITFNLLVVEARNLDYLLPEVLVFKQNQERYHMTFKIFGVSLRTKPFHKELHDSIVLDEKVVVRVLSTATILQEFLKTQSVVVSFFSGHEKLGTTEVELSEVSFDETESLYYFKVATTHDETKQLSFGDNDQSPSIRVKIWLKKSSENYQKILKPSDECPLPKTRVSNITKSMLVNAAGDSVSMHATQSDPEDGLNHEESVIQNCIPLSPTFTSKSYEISNQYRKYLVEITLASIMWNVQLKKSKVIFKFIHPKAYSCVNIFTSLDTTIEKTIPLNISMKLIYISTSADIEELLKSWPPKFVLSDELEQVICDVLVLTHAMIFGNEVTTLSLKYMNQTLGCLDTKVKFNICDIEKNEGTSDNSLLHPPVIDEFLTLNELADIEKWKMEQKSEFEKHLEQLKTDEIDRLNDENRQRRNDLEMKLNKHIEQCRKLQETLQCRLNQMKTDKYLKEGRETLKIEEVNMENLEMYIRNNNIEEVALKLATMQSDNEVLRNAVDKQRAEIEELQKVNTAKDESTSLLRELKDLEEKFIVVQQCKILFQAKLKNGETCGEERLLNSANDEEDASDN